MRLRRGFSLVETMIAVMTLSFTVLVFAAVFPAAAQMRQKGEDVTRATMLAHQKLEQLRGVGYANLTYSNLRSAGIIDASPTTSPYAITGVSGLATALAEGTGTLTITDAGTDPDGEVSLKQARVDIIWGGITTQGRSVSLVSFIANRDIKVQ